MILFGEIIYVTEFLVTVARLWCPLGEHVKDLSDLFLVFTENGQIRYVLAILFSFWNCVWQYNFLMIYCAIF